MKPHLVIARLAIPLLCRTAGSYHRRHLRSEYEPGLETRQETVDIGLRSMVADRNFDWLGNSKGTTEATEATEGLREHYPSGHQGQSLASVASVVQHSSACPERRGRFNGS